MSEDEFWKLIEAARAEGDTIDELVDTLRGALEEMPRERVVAFQRALNSVMARACTWDLIGAACFLGCGQSDDGFEDFRAWLVAQGRKTFESVLHDVERLAEIPFDESPTEEWHGEELHMLPGDVGGEAGDSQWPYFEDPEQPHGLQVRLSKGELRVRFPKLWEAFGDEFMIGVE